MIRITKDLIKNLEIQMNPNSSYTIATNDQIDKIIIPHENYYSHYYFNESNGIYWFAIDLDSNVYDLGSNHNYYHANGEKYLDFWNNGDQFNPHDIVLFCSMEFVIENNESIYDIVVFPYKKFYNVFWSNWIMCFFSMFKDER